LERLVVKSSYLLAPLDRAAGCDYHAAVGKVPRRIWVARVVQERRQREESLKRAEGITFSSKEMHIILLIAAQGGL
jgi:hypothetical protein